MTLKVHLKNKAGFVLLLPLVGCTLQLDFAGQKTGAKVVSYRGDAGLDGTHIGSTLAAADINGDNTGAGVNLLNDLIIGQELDAGLLASIPVSRVADPSDLRTHYQTADGTSLPGNVEDQSSRHYGAAVTVQDLGGGAGHEGQELIVGAPGLTTAAGNVVVFDGDAKVFSFGKVIARLAGAANEPLFGQSIALGDLDGATVGGVADTFQVLAVGAPDVAAGSVYLFRSSIPISSVEVCNAGTPAALQIDAAAVAAALPTSTAIGPSFGAQVAIGELGGFFSALDDRAELVVTEPDANRMFVFSFLPSANPCDPMQIDPLGAVEIPLSDKPAAIALLDAGSAGAKIAVGLPGAQSGVGEIALCTSDLINGPSCTSLPNPAPTYERLGQFTLGSYGQALISGDLNDDNGDGVRDSNDPDDLLVGAPASIVGGVASAGAAVMLFSDGAGSFDTAADHVQVLADLAPEANAVLGSALAIVGDLSGDGLAEVAVGAPGAAAGKGEALLYLDITAPGFVPPP